MKADKDLVVAFGTGLLEDVFPYLANIFPSSRYTTVLKLMNYIFDWINKNIAEHKESFNPGNVFVPCANGLEVDCVLYVDWA